MGFLSSLLDFLISTAESKAKRIDGIEDNNKLEKKYSGKSADELRKFANTANEFANTGRSLQERLSNQEDDD